MTTPAIKKIQSPYAPRRAFVPFHKREARWACLVAHRRAGKTVAAVNDMIKRALEAPPAPYHYFAPYRSQAKAVAWEYFKMYSRGLWRKPPNEAELKVFLVGEGRDISLYGADNADAARGQGSGGVYCDEYGDFRPSVWGNVIRPMLSERRGWAVFGGTPKGHNQFYDLYRRALSLAKGENDGDFDGGWFVATLKASETGILHPAELRAARAQLSDDQYQQEYECSFDAAILGAFYGKEMSRVDAEGRIGEVAYQPGFPVNTYWDIGYRDDTCIWLAQNVGDEIHVLDCIAESGADLDYFVGELKKRPYRYGRHWLPHDARAKTLASGGKSIIEQLARMLGIGAVGIVPSLSVEDGIQATRRALARTWFDNRCNLTSTSGVEALRQYQRAWDEDKKAFSKAPLHDWCSHYADAFRMLAIAEAKQEVESAIVKPPAWPVLFPEARPTLDQLWDEHDESQYNRLLRI